MISIWQESENEIQELRQIIHILDTIHAYYKQTKDLLIVDNFNEKVGNYLQRADILLEKQWKRPDISDFLISLPYFFLHYRGEKEIAKKWIDRFDSKNISLNHYAQFVSICYHEVKGVIK